MNGAIPPRNLPISARAPGKCILFGEHAVVRGAPELLFALDLDAQVVVRGSERTELNADPNASSSNPYFRAALAQAWVRGGPVSVRSVTRLPRAAGLGSSAAFIAALAAALASLSGGTDRAQLAQRAFDIEREAQGVGSPGDTSASVAGGYLAVNAGTGEKLWTVARDEERWEVARIEDPGWVWAIAYSGVPRSTAEAVRSVGRRFDGPGGDRLLAEFRAVATEGVDAVRAGDRARTGELLLRNQALLREVGVSHPRLEELLDAAAPVAEGAKLTGAGAGGSIVALPKPGRETELIRRLARAGGLPFAVHGSADGASLVELGTTDSA
jgi:mevalonate kinase